MADRKWNDPVNWSSPSSDNELDAVFDENERSRYSTKPNTIPSTSESEGDSDGKRDDKDDDENVTYRMDTHTHGNYDTRHAPRQRQNNAHLSSHLSINELLSKALEEAANPGEGDEEPEILPNPNHPMEADAEGEGEGEGDGDGEGEREGEEGEGKGEDDEDNLHHDNHGDDGADGSTPSSSSAKVRGAKAQNKSREAGGSDMKRARRDPLEAQAEAARIAMAEEERRVAALQFDADALAPLDQNLLERARHIPLRLTYEERKGLRLVNAAIGVSDYTNVVDGLHKSKARRKHCQLQLIVSFMTGLVAADKYEWGQEVLASRNFVQHAHLLRDKLEVARRYKITNPEKFRTEYGKLVYLLQDTIDPDIHKLLGVSIHAPIKTVYALCEEKGALALLEDDRLATATEEILSEPDKNREHTKMAIERKEKAVRFLVNKYSMESNEGRRSSSSYNSYSSYSYNNYNSSYNSWGSSSSSSSSESSLDRVPTRMTADEVRLCLYSLSDNNSFLNTNKRPIEECQRLLEHYFSETHDGDPETSLAIDVGDDGARLSHSHAMQFNYVKQSLALWAAIIDDMFRLWALAEQDLLREDSRYELRHTGQGLQRVQPSPLVYQAMHQTLARTKQSLGTWVGSSVIHLGDNNVPNALMFVDKYLQVSQILGPLVNTLGNIDKACAADKGLTAYMLAYGGVDRAKRTILRDFFTHAFDGSGGDNFFDAGSCIDGRLTSAWNWCSQIADKPYYPLFRLTGFLSFDVRFYLPLSLLFLSAADPTPPPPYILLSLL